METAFWYEMNPSSLVAFINGACSSCFERGTVEEAGNSGASDQG
jgi:hypothetical protein